MVAYTNELNQKEYAIGDIVYFIDPFVQDKWDWGVVEEHYSDGYAIALYEIVNDIMIDGIPINEFPFNHPRKKLPKGWTYNTQLYQISNDPKWTKIKKEEIYTGEKENLRHLIDIGLFVRPSSQLHGAVESDINKDGYTIRLNSYYGDKHRSDYAVVTQNNCYNTVKEAQNIVDAYKAELKRQSELSDYEWSVEQIDKTLNKLTWMDSEYKAKVRDWLLKQDNVEDIVTRATTNGIEWKYDRNKKWMLVMV